MQSIGILQDISIDYKTNKPKITLLLDQRESISSLEEIKDSKLSIEIKKHRKSRSIDANKYFWKLLQEVCEYKDIDTYIAINKILKIINEQRDKPTIEQLEIINKLLSMFEEEHKDDKTSKGKRLIKYQYSERM